MSEQGQEQAKPKSKVNKGPVWRTINACKTKIIDLEERVSMVEATIQGLVAGRAIVAEPGAVMQKPKGEERPTLDTARQNYQPFLKKGGGKGVQAAYVLAAGEAPAGFLIAKQTRPESVDRFLASYRPASGAIAGMPEYVEDEVAGS